MVACRHFETTISPIPSNNATDVNGGLVATMEATRLGERKAGTNPILARPELQWPHWRTGLIPSGYEMITFPPGLLDTTLRTAPFADTNSV